MFLLWRRSYNAVHALSWVGNFNIVHLLPLHLHQDYMHDCNTNHRKLIQTEQYDQETLAWYFGSKDLKLDDWSCLVCETVNSMDRYFCSSCQCVAKPNGRLISEWKNGRRDNPPYPVISKFGLDEMDALFYRVSKCDRCTNLMYVVDCRCPSCGFEMSDKDRKLMIEAESRSTRITYGKVTVFVVAGFCLLVYLSHKLLA